jgi:glycosyltransferase 2 family protein
MIRSSLESKLYILQRGAPQATLIPLPTESPTSRPRPSRVLALIVLGSLLVVVLLAYRTRGVSFRWNLFLKTLEQVEWRWLGVSICLILLSNLVRALRWQVMLRALLHKAAGTPIGLWRLTSDTAIGLSAGVLLGRIGEVVRPYLIAVQTGLPFSSQAAAWLLERMLDLLVVLLLCGYALIRLPRFGWGVGTGGYSLVVAFAICLLLLLAFRDPERRANRRILSALAFLPERQQHRAAQMLDAFSQGVECTRDASSLALLLGYTLLEWVVVIASSLAVFHGFSATAGFGLVDVLVLLAFTTIGSMVQLPGVGGGAQVASIVALTKIYEVPLEAASGIAILQWMVGALAIVPFGLACAFHEGLNWSKLKLLSTKQILDQPEA